MGTAPARCFISQHPGSARSGELCIRFVVSSGYALSNYAPFVSVKLLLSHRRIEICLNTNPSLGPDAELTSDVSPIHHTSKNHSSTLIGSCAFSYSKHSMHSPGYVAIHVSSPTGPPVLSLATIAPALCVQELMCCGF